MVLILNTHQCASGQEDAERPAGVYHTPGALHLTIGLNCSAIVEHISMRDVNASRIGNIAVLRESLQSRGSPFGEQDRTIDPASGNCSPC
jgi:hypothetical protein